MQHITSNRLMEAYGGAMSALAQLDERIALSPHRDLLLVRLRMAEREALDSIERQFAAWPRGWSKELAASFLRRPSPTTLTAEGLCDWLLKSEPETFDWFARLEHNPDASGWPRFAVDHVRLKALERYIAVSAGLPRLLAGAEIAAQRGRLTPLAFGNAAIGLLIGGHFAMPEARHSIGGLVAIGLMRRGIDWSGPVTGGQSDWQGAWLEAIVAGGQAVLELDQRLGDYLACAEQTPWAGRPTSRLRDLAELVARRPTTTINLVSSRLCVSRPTAHKLLETALSARFVREVSLQACARQFVAAL